MRANCVIVTDYPRMEHTSYIQSMGKPVTHVGKLLLVNIKNNTKYSEVVNKFNILIGNMLTNYLPDINSHMIYIVHKQSNSR